MFYFNIYILFFNRRPAASRAGSNAGGGSLSGGFLRYNDDAPGLKMYAFDQKYPNILFVLHLRGPQTVLIFSLFFIGLVIFLHIWGKFRS